jgi:hypothetical protein
VFSVKIKFRLPSVGTPDSKERNTFNITLHNNVGTCEQNVFTSSPAVIGSTILCVFCEVEGIKNLMT